MPKQPPKSSWKTVRVFGGTVSYQDETRMGEFVKDLRARLKKAAKERQAKAAKRAAIPPPDLTPTRSFVSFIDILGFRAEVQRAKTKRQLQQAYAKIRLVQKEFQKPSATDDPEEQARLDSEYGRRVIALSDAVVVVITPNCPAVQLIGEYDLLGFAVYDLILAQARCAVTHGIFVRGGISHGPFFFVDDVLLSPALASAYELESKHAEYPLIVLPESTRQALLKAPKKGHYKAGTDPTPRFLAKHGMRKWRREQLYFLDYASAMLEEDHRGWLPEDHKDYLDARKERDEEKAQAALDRRALKDAAYFLQGHRRRIEDAYNANASERVRKKYRWLMNYHNRSFRHDLDYVRDQVIDLSRFQRPEEISTRYRKGP